MSHVMSLNPVKPFFSSKVVRRGGPESVIYDLNSPHQTRITLPVGSTWSSGLHWHEIHAEYLRIIKGRVKINLEGKEMIIEASNDGDTGQAPLVKVEKGVIHEWSRASCEGGDDVIVIETTDPADGEKQVFFWCVNGTVLEGIENIKASSSDLERYLQEWILWWKLCAVFRELDNWPVVWDARSLPKNIPGSRTLEWLITHVVLALAALLGGLCGVRAVSKKFLPEEIWDRWFVTKRMGPAFEAKDN